MLPLTNTTHDSTENSAVPQRVATKSDPASGINFARVFAAFLVVFAHCTSPYFHNPPDGMTSFSWGWVTILLSFLAVCVPLFFLLAGFVLLRPGVQPAPFYKRRVKKLLVPLLGWSAIYILMRISLEGNQISLLSSIRLIYNGEVYVHLWFLYVMLALYLSLPIISPLADRKHRLLLIWFAGFSILLGSVLPFVNEVLTAISGYPFHHKVPSGFFSMSLGYMVIGALSRDLHLDEKRSRFVFAGLILSVLVTVAITSIGSVADGKPTSNWMDMTGPGIVGTAICLFLLLKGVSVSPRVSRILRHLSNWSFGLYLSHPLVMKLLSITGWESPRNPAVGIPYISALVLLCSIVLVVVLSKIPFLRRIV